MRIDWSVFLFSIILGLFLLAADILFDKILLYDHLITLPLVGEAQSNEIVMRLLMLALLSVFGVVCGRLVYRLNDLQVKKSETAEFLQQLIEAIPIPVFYKDDKNRYIGCNDRFANFIKLPGIKL